jgi:hypothetical protein
LLEKTLQANLQALAAMAGKSGMSRLVSSEVGLVRTLGNRLGFLADTLDGIGVDLALPRCRYQP